MKHALLVTAVICGLLSVDSIAWADYAAERAYLEKEIDRVCSDTIGARYNSKVYFDCRSYYDRRFYDYGYDWNRLTPEQVSEFLNVIHPFVDRCRNLGLVSTLLWGCIRDYGDGHYHDWSKHHPDFRPKHEYRPHFERGPASASKFEKGPNSKQMDKPRADRGLKAERKGPQHDMKEKNRGPEGKGSDYSGPKR